jgi:transcriptional regulator with XRE-family HTH domain
MLGANLRQLAKGAQSISALCRELGINRTQFNRYLAGESFPRPDVLHRICSFFDVDARILLEPVNEISDHTPSLLQHPEIAEFIGATKAVVTEAQFPSGFFRYSRRSFMQSTKFVSGLAYVYRQDGHAFMKGFEARQAMQQQGLGASKRAREFRGFMIPHETGVSTMVCRRGAMNVSFNFLAPVASFDSNFWVGYTSRAGQETPGHPRVTRVVYEHLRGGLGEALSVARNAGLGDIDTLPPFHRAQFESDQEFN